MKAECHQWRRSSDPKSCISPQNKFAFPPQKFRITGITASTAEAQPLLIFFFVQNHRQHFHQFMVHRLTESWDSLAVAPVSVLFGHFEPRFYPRPFFPRKTFNRPLFLSSLRPLSFQSQDMSHRFSPSRAESFSRWISFRRLRCFRSGVRTSTGTSPDRRVWLYSGALRSPPEPVSSPDGMVMMMMVMMAMIMIVMKMVVTESGALRSPELVSSPDGILPTVIL